MLFNRHWLLLAITLILPGCKIEIVSPENGGVTTQSGNYECASGETCVVDVVDQLFKEEFIAKAAPGYAFKQWAKQKKRLCGGKKGSCTIESSYAGLNELTMLILNSAANLILEPVFERATNNLAATSFDVISADPRIGYPLKVSMDIDAIETTENVRVAFFAIDKDRPTVRQFAIGAHTIERVETGNNALELELDVPTSLKISGPYYIGALVDAADAHDEIDEEDNETSTVVDFSPVQSPNLFIDYIEPDRTAIVLDRRSFDYQEQADLGVVNSDAGGTVTWGVKGAERPIDVEAFVVLRLTRSDAGGGGEPPVGVLSVGPTMSADAGTESYDVPLYLWNSEAERYMNAYEVDPVMGDTGVEEWLPVGPVGEFVVAGTEGREDVPVTEFDRRSAHLDFYFPGKLAEELEIALRKLNVLRGPAEPPPDLSAADIQALRDFLFGVEPEVLSSALCVSIRPVDRDIMEDQTDDNEICSPLALILPELPPNPPVPVPPPVPPLYRTPGSPVFFDELYRTDWGGRNFGFGVDFSASLSADNRGAIVTALGALPVRAFGRSFEFMRVEGRAQVLPVSERDNPPPGQNPGFTLELRHVGLSLYYKSVASGSLGPLQIFFTKEIADVERIVTIGPVPVKLKAGVAGNIGAEYSIAFGAAAGNGLELTTAPYAKIEAEAAASVTGSPR